MHWPTLPNEHGDTMLWFGSWLTGNEGIEGPWFYSGRGGDVLAYTVPTEATGARIRRWPNEGLDAEYADILRFPPDGEILAVEDLDFDSEQQFSRFAEFEPHTRR